jgi:Asp-tRNA(Asn)/Glu-tRNA(Gln) amidotransferase A subunit family amidase
VLPPRIDALTPETLLPTVIELTQHVTFVNAAGAPASAQPVPAPGLALPGSLQLVGPLGGEEVILATAAKIEAAAGWRMQ